MHIPNWTMMLCQSPVQVYISMSSVGNLKTDESAMESQNRQLGGVEIWGMLQAPCATGGFATGVTWGVGDFRHPWQHGSLLGGIWPAGGDTCYCHKYTKGPTPVISSSHCLSFPEASVISKGNMWLSAAVTVPDKEGLSRGSGACNGPLSLAAIRCWYCSALKPPLGLHGLFWKCQVMCEVGTSLPPMQFQCFFCTKSSILNFINFPQFPSNVFSKLTFHFSGSPRGHRGNAQIG